VLTSQPTAGVTISLASSNTGEGTVSPSSLSFSTVNWATAQTVTVTGVNDWLAVQASDGSEAYTRHALRRREHPTRQVGLDEFEAFAAVRREGCLAAAGGVFVGPLRDVECDQNLRCRALNEQRFRLQAQEASAQAGYARQGNRLR
jgi:hypothetical protein